MQYIPRISYAVWAMLIVVVVLAEIQLYPYLLVLTPCGAVTPYGVIDVVNIGSANGFLPDGTKPLPKPMLNNQQWGLVTFSRGQFH